MEKRTMDWNWKEMGKREIISCTLAGIVLTAGILGIGFAIHRNSLQQEKELQRQVDALTMAYQLDCLSLAAEMRKKVDAETAPDFAAAQKAVPAVTKKLNGIFFRTKLFCSDGAKYVYLSDRGMREACIQVLRKPILEPCDHACQIAGQHLALLSEKLQQRYFRYAIELMNLYRKAQQERNSALARKWFAKHGIAAGEIPAVQPVPIRRLAPEREVRSGIMEACSAIGAYSCISAMRPAGMMYGRMIGAFLESETLPRQYAKKLKTTVPEIRIRLLNDVCEASWELIGSYEQAAMRLAMNPDVQRETPNDKQKTLAKSL